MKRKPRYLMDSPSDRQRHYYRAHKSLGKCARCSNPPVPGKACCQGCLDKMAAGKRAAREQGLCLDCWTAPALPGKRYCATHRALRSEEQHRRSMIRFVKRLCQYCGKKRVYGTSNLCKEHLKRDRERKRARRVQ
jgi:hypothetical protein